MTENGGIFVCKTRHLVLAGGTKVSIATVFLCLSACEIFSVEHLRNPIVKEYIASDAAVQFLPIVFAIFVLSEKFNFW